MIFEGSGLKITNVKQADDGYYDADIEITPEFQQFFMKKMNWPEWDEFAFSQLINEAIMKYVNNKRTSRGEKPIES